MSGTSGGGSYDVVLRTKIQAEFDENDINNLGKTLDGLGERFVSSFADGKQKSELQENLNNALGMFDVETDASGIKTYKLSQAVTQLGGSAIPGIIRELQMFGRALTDITTTTKVYKDGERADAKYATAYRQMVSSGSVFKQMSNMAFSSKDVESLLDASIRYTAKAFASMSLNNKHALSREGWIGEMQNMSSLRSKIEDVAVKRKLTSILDNEGHLKDEDYNDLIRASFLTLGSRSGIKEAGALFAPLYERSKRVYNPNEIFGNRQIQELYTRGAKRDQAYAGNATGQQQVLYSDPLYRGIRRLQASDNTAAQRFAIESGLARVEKANADEMALDGNKNPGVVLRWNLNPTKDQMRLFLAKSVAEGRRIRGGQAIFERDADLNSNISKSFREILDITNLFSDRANDQNAGKQFIEDFINPAGLEIESEIKKNMPKFSAGGYTRMQSTVGKIPTYAVPYTTLQKDKDGNISLVPVSQSDMHKVVERTGQLKVRKDDKGIMLQNSWLTHMLGYNPKDNGSFGRGYDENGKAVFFGDNPDIVAMPISDTWAKDEEGFYLTGDKRVKTSLGQNLEEVINKGTVRYGENGTELMPIYSNGQSFIFANAKKVNNFRNDTIKSGLSDPLSGYDPFAPNGFVNGEYDATNKQLTSRKRMGTQGNSLADILPGYNISGMNYGTFSIDAQRRLNQYYGNQIFGNKSVDGAGLIDPEYSPFSFQVRGLGYNLKGVLGNYDWRDFLRRTVKKTDAAEASPFMGFDENDQLNKLLMPNVSFSKLSEKEQDEIAEAIRSNTLYNGKNRETLLSENFQDIMTPELAVLFEANMLKGKSQMSYIREDQFSDFLQHQMGYTAKDAAEELEKRRKEAGYYITKDVGNGDEGFIRLKNNELNKNIKSSINNGGGLIAVKSEEDFSTGKRTIGRQLADAIGFNEEMRRKSAQLYAKELEQMEDDSYWIDVDQFASRPDLQQAFESADDKREFLKTDRAVKYIQDKKKALQKESLTRYRLSNDSATKLAFPFLGSLFEDAIINAGAEINPDEDLSIMYSSMLGNESFLKNRFGFDDKTLNQLKTRDEKGNDKIDITRMLFSPEARGAWQIVGRTPSSLNTFSKMLNLGYHDQIQNAFNQLRGGSTDVAMMLPDAIDFMNTGDFDGDTVWMYAAQMSLLSKGLEAANKSVKLSDEENKELDDMIESQMKSLRGKKSKDTVGGRQLDQMFDYFQGQGEMGKASQIMRNAVDIYNLSGKSKEDQEAFAKAYQLGSKYYDKATSEGQTMGWQGDYTSGILFDVFRAGRSFNRFKKIVGESYGVPDEDLDENQPGIFTHRLKSLNNILDISDSVSEARMRKARGGIDFGFGDMVDDWVNRNYGADSGHYNDKLYQYVLQYAKILKGQNDLSYLPTNTELENFYTNAERDLTLEIKKLDENNPSQAEQKIFLEKQLKNILSTKNKTPESNMTLENLSAYYRRADQGSAVEKTLLDAQMLYASDRMSSREKELLETEESIDHQRMIDEERAKMKVARATVKATTEGDVAGFIRYWDDYFKPINPTTTQIEDFIKHPVSLPIQEITYDKNGQNIKAGSIEELFNGEPLFWNELYQDRNLANDMRKAMGLPEEVEVHTPFGSFVHDVFRNLLLETDKERQESGKEHADYNVGDFRKKAKEIWDSGTTKIGNSNVTWKDYLTGNTSEQKIDDPLTEEEWNAISAWLGSDNPSELKFQGEAKRKLVDKINKTFSVNNNKNDMFLQHLFGKGRLFESENQIYDPNEKNFIIPYGDHSDMSVPDIHGKEGENTKYRPDLLWELENGDLVMYDWKPNEKGGRKSIYQMIKYAREAEVESQKAYEKQQAGSDLSDYDKRFLKYRTDKGDFKLKTLVGVDYTGSGSDISFDYANNNGQGGLVDLVMDKNLKTARDLWKEKRSGEGLLDGFRMMVNAGIINLDDQMPEAWDKYFTHAKTFEDLRNSISTFKQKNTKEGRDFSGKDYVEDHAQEWNYLVAKMSQNREKLSGITDRIRSAQGKYRTRAITDNEYSIFDSIYDDMSLLDDPELYGALSAVYEDVLPYAVKDVANFAGDTDKQKIALDKLVEKASVIDPQRTAKSFQKKLYGAKENDVFSRVEQVVNQANQAAGVRQSFKHEFKEFFETPGQKKDEIWEKAGQLAIESNKYSELDFSQQAEDARSAVRNFVDNTLKKDYSFTEDQAGRFMNKARMYAEAQPAIDELRASEHELIARLYEDDKKQTENDIFKLTNKTLTPGEKAQQTIDTSRRNINNYIASSKLDMIQSDDEIEKLTNSLSASISKDEKNMIASLAQSGKTSEVDNIIQNLNPEDIGIMEQIKLVMDKKKTLADAIQALNNYLDNGFNEFAQETTKEAELKQIASNYQTIQHAQQFLTSMGITPSPVAQRVAPTAPVPAVQPEPVVETPALATTPVAMTEPVVEAVSAEPETTIRTKNKRFAEPVIKTKVSVAATPAKPKQNYESDTRKQWLADYQTKQQEEQQQAKAAKQAQEEKEAEEARRVQEEAEQKQKEEAERVEEARLAKEDAIRAQKQDYANFIQGVPSTIQGYANSFDYPYVVDSNALATRREEIGSRLKTYETERQNILNEQYNTENLDSQIDKSNTRISELDKQISHQEELARTDELRNRIKEINGQLPIVEQEAKAKAEEAYHNLPSFEKGITYNLPYYQERGLTDIYRYTKKRVQKATSELIAERDELQAEVKTRESQFGTERHDETLLDKLRIERQEEDTRLKEAEQKRSAIKGSELSQEKKERLNKIASDEARDKSIEQEALEGLKNSAIGQIKESVLKDSDKESIIADIKKISTVDAALENIDSRSSAGRALAQAVSGNEFFKDIVKTKAQEQGTTSKKIEEKVENAAQKPVQDNTQTSAVSMQISTKPSDASEKPILLYEKGIKTKEEEEAEAREKEARDKEDRQKRKIEAVEQEGKRVKKEEEQQDSVRTAHRGNIQGTYRLSTPEEVVPQEQKKAEPVQSTVQPVQTTTITTTTTTTQTSSSLVPPAGGQPPVPPNNPPTPPTTPEPSPIRSDIIGMAAQSRTAQQRLEAAKIYDQLKALPEATKNDPYVASLISQYEMMNGEGARVGETNGFWKDREKENEEDIRKAREEQLRHTQAASDLALRQNAHRLKQQQRRYLPRAGIIGRGIGQVQDYMYANKMERDQLAEKIKQEEARLDQNKEYRALQEKYKNASPEEQKDITDQINQMRAPLNQYEAQMKQAEQATTGFAGVMGGLNAAVSPAITGLEALFKRFGRQMFYKALNEAKRFVKEFDATMTSIQMITLKSDDQMSTLGDGLISKAKELKVSITELGKVYETLYRQGLSDEEVEERAEGITKFSKVSGTDVKAATKLVTIAMNTGLAASSQEVMDVVTALGDNAATNATEISKGFEKAGAAAAADGTTLAELASMLTAITSTTQIGGNVAGRTLNTIIGRMNKIGTNELIYDENGNAVSGSAIAKLLKQQGINMYDENGNKKSTYETLYALAQKWEGMSDAQQQQIANAIAGTRQYSNFSAIMQGMSEGKVDEYMNLAKNSEGIVDEKNEVRLKSLAAAMDTVKNAWDEMIYSMGVNGELKSVAEGIASIITGLGKAVTSLTKMKALAPTILAIFGAMKGAQFGGLLNMIPVVGKYLSLIGALVGGGLGALAGSALENTEVSKEEKSASSLLDEYYSEQRKINSADSKNIERFESLYNKGKDRTVDENIEYGKLFNLLSDGRTDNLLNETASNASDAINKMSESALTASSSLDEYAKEIIERKKEEELTNEYETLRGGLARTAQAVTEEYEKSHKIYNIDISGFMEDDTKSPSARMFKSLFDLSNGKYVLSEEFNQNDIADVSQDGYSNKAKITNKGLENLRKIYKSAPGDYISFIERGIQYLKDNPQSILHSGIEYNEDVLRKVLLDWVIDEENATFNNSLKYSSKNKKEIKSQTMLGLYALDDIAMYLTGQVGKTNDQTVQKQLVSKLKNQLVNTFPELKDVEIEGAIQQIAQELGDNPTEEDVNNYLSNLFPIHSTRKNALDNLKDLYYRSLNLTEGEYKVLQQHNSGYYLHNGEYIGIKEAQNLANNELLNPESQAHKYIVDQAYKIYNESLTGYERNDSNVKIMLKRIMPDINTENIEDNTEVLTQAISDYIAAGGKVIGKLASEINKKKAEIELEYDYIDNIFIKAADNNYENVFLNKNQTAVNADYITGLLSSSTDVVEFMHAINTNAMAGEAWSQILQNSPTLNQIMKSVSYDYDTGVLTAPEDIRNQLIHALMNESLTYGKTSLSTLQTGQLAQTAYNGLVNDNWYISQAEKDKQLENSYNQFTKNIDDTYRKNELDAAIKNENTAIIDEINNEKLKLKDYDKFIADNPELVNTEAMSPEMATALQSVLGNMYQPFMRSLRGEQISSEANELIQKLINNNAHGLKSLTNTDKISGIGKILRSNIFDTDVALQYLNGFSGAEEFIDLYNRRGTLEGKDLDHYNALLQQLKNYEQNLRISIEVEGIKSLEDAGQLLDGTTSAIEKLKKGGKFTIEATVEIKREVFDEKQKYASLYNGTEYEQHEIARSMLKMSEDEYYANPEENLIEGKKLAEVELGEFARSKATERAFMSASDQAELDQMMAGMGLVYNSALPDGWKIKKGDIFDENGQYQRRATSQDYGYYTSNGNVGNAQPMSSGEVIDFINLKYKQGDKANLAGSKLFETLTSGNITSLYGPNGLVSAIGGLDNLKELLESSADLRKVFEDLGAINSPDGGIDFTNVEDSAAGLEAALQALIPAVAGTTEAYKNYQNVLSTGETQERAMNFWNGEGNKKQGYEAFKQFIGNDQIAQYVSNSWDEYQSKVKKYNEYKAITDETARNLWIEHNGGIPATPDEFDPLAGIDYNSPEYQYVQSRVWNAKRGITGLTEYEKYLALSKAVGYANANNSEKGIESFRLNDHFGMYQDLTSNIEGFDIWAAVVGEAQKAGMSIEDLEEGTEEYNRVLANVGVTTEQWEKAQYNVNKALKDGRAALKSGTGAIQEQSNAFKNFNSQLTSIAKNQYFAKQFKEGKRDQNTLNAIRSMTGLDLNDDVIKSGKFNKTILDSLENLEDADKESLQQSLDAYQDDLSKYVEGTTLTIPNGPSVEIVGGHANISLESITEDVSGAMSEEQANLIALLKSFGVKAHYQIDKEGNSVFGHVVIDDISSLSSIGKPSGGGGGGKSAVDKLLEEQKRKLAVTEHEVKMLQIEEKELDYNNDYTGQIDNINEQVDAQYRLKQAYTENIKELQDMLAKTKEESDDWYKLRDAIYAAEEALASINSAINEVNQKRITALDQVQQIQDKPGTHMQTMLEKLASRAMSEDRFADYVNLTEQRMAEIDAQQSLNSAQLKEWENELLTYEEGSDAWIEVRDKIWALEEENAELENQSIQQTLELNQQRLAQIAKVLEYDTGAAVHNQNIANTYGSFYQNSGYRSAYEDMIRSQVESNTVILEENRKAEQAAREQMASLEEGTASWYEARSAVYQYQEAIAQTTVSQYELNRSLAESNLESISEVYTDATRELFHVNELLEAQAQEYLTANDYQTYSEAMTRYIANITDELTAETKALAELNAQYEAGMEAGTLDPTMQRQYLDQINERESAVQRLQLEQINKQREYDKTNLDYILELQDRAESDYQHNLNLVQYQQTKYQNNGEWTNYGRGIELDSQLRKEHISTLEDELEALKERQKYYQNRYGEGTDEEIRIVEQIKKREEAIESENVQLEKNNKLLEENEKKIRQIQKTLEDAVDKEIEAEKKRQREILSANVSMQDTILNLLKKRLQDEWALRKKDLEKEKESLNEYKKLINERFNYRKKASQQADKDEELADYRRQLALIEADPTRTKDAKELRRKIEDLEKEQAWTIAEDELNAENERIDQQTEGIDNYVVYNEEKLNEILSDANNFSTELSSILTGSYEESYQNIIDFMEKENEAFVKSLPDAQKQMIQSWEDTWKQANDIVDSNYALITSILTSKDSFMDYMKNTNREYRSLRENNDQNSMRIMESTWSDYYDNFVNSRIDNAEFDLHDHTIGDVVSKIDELEDNVFKVNIIGIEGNAPYPSGFSDDYKWQDRSNGAGYTLNDYAGVGYVEPTVEPIQDATSTSGGNGNGSGMKSYTIIDPRGYTTSYVITAESEAVAKKIAKEKYGIKTDNSTNYSLIETSHVSDPYTPKASTTNVTSDTVIPKGSFVKPTEDKTIIDRLYDLFGFNGYDSGGYVDYTGLARVHGTKTRPESFLDSVDTALLREQLDAYKYVRTVPYMSHIDTSSFGTNYNVGDVNIVINQAEINNDQDINALAKKIGQAFTKELKINGIGMNGYTFA